MKILLRQSADQDDKIKLKIISANLLSGLDIECSKHEYLKQVSVILQFQYPTVPGVPPVPGVPVAQLIQTLK